MQDPFITALNTQKAALGWFEELSVNLGNIYTPGYRSRQTTFSDFINGVEMQQTTRKADQGKAIPGRAPSNLFIEGSGYFVLRTNDGQLRYSRLGDFEFQADGSLVNAKGWKVQAYMLGENGEVLNISENSPLAPNRVPGLAQGGPGQTPTTEINLWVDPSNGKYFGKYDEYKVQSDGTVVGLSNGGKTVTPLYRVALAGFTNAGALREVEDQYFVPTPKSGQALAGTGEVRSGLLEESNTSLRESVAYLQQAKLQLDVTAKIVSTNKTLLEEALRLIQ
ncbi:MAG: flagellar hook-basal body complex protein [Vampirovibrionales bacterium]